jgi:enamine deaminase RidA (YjgF/YER057c/UK114 family)
VTDRRPSERLADLGLKLPEVVAPVASYRPAVRSGVHVYVSGQLPVVAGNPVPTGTVGADVDIPAAVEMARRCALNGLAAAAEVAGGVDRLVRVVKVVGFVASAPGFTAQSHVLNGASDLLVDIFGESGRHARSAIGVAGLPLGAPVEVEMVLEAS